MTRQFRVDCQTFPSHFSSMNETIGTTEKNSIDYSYHQQPILFVCLLLTSIVGLCSILLIFAFVFNHWYSMMKKSLHYHAIFLLNFISFLYITLDIPFSLTFLRLGEHPYRSIPFCLWWYWFDFSILNMSLLVTATASVQRHILVFYSHWFQLRRRRLLFHYFPFAISIIYPLIFYTIFIFFYPCDIYFHINDVWCAYPCFLDHVTPYIIDWIFNVAFPVLIIIIANIALVIKVFRSMKRVRQQHRNIWKRQKKLTLQLLGISSIYVLVYVPTTVATLATTTVSHEFEFETPNLFHDFFYLICFVCPVQSFLCIFILPELIGAIQRRCRWFCRRTIIDRSLQIHPTTFTRSLNVRQGQL